ncbi:hypothetical protein CARUB_v10010999mg [Capsella rubella]|uniref:Uncharacterized protein n=1 Tax=Capsella rubella TaxID=81985 RepID=R0I2I4_9BRAS|nr:hypothetical protein CARUB_v10010999mg [Capsella rubella]
MNMYGHSSGFMDLLTSQQENQNAYDDDFEPTTDDQSLAVHKPKNKSNTFFSRIVYNYVACPKLVGVEKSVHSYCMKRWQRINDTVSKFGGSYEATTNSKSSGQNEEDHGSSKIIRRLMSSLHQALCKLGLKMKKLILLVMSTRALMEFQSMWDIKHKDLTMKERLGKDKMFDSLLGKTEPLFEM